MNFFEHQDDARNRSKRLVVIFGIAVAAIITAIYFVFAIVFQGHRGTLWNPEVLLYVTAGTLFIIGLGSLYKTVQLRKGGAALAERLGGSLVPPNTNDPDLKKLRNVVEEMSIASGMPVPLIYVMNGESSINAFAAGLTPNDAVVGVTRGCIEKLNRDELQGVIAHEFSHILHGDMRLNIRLMGVVHGILIIGIAGLLLMRSVAFSGRGRSRGGGKGGQAIIAILGIGLALFVIGYIGVFFGRLIKAGVSRQREFLADASSVQFTRNPTGISGALKKIGGFTDGSRLDAKHADEASHMFFGNGTRKRMLFSSMLATHPPLEKRIKTIDPSFDGEFTTISRSFRASDEPFSQLAGGATSDSQPATDQKTPKIAGTTKHSEIGATADQLVGHIGDPQPEHVAYSHKLLENLPTEARDAAHEPFGARAVVYCLLLDENVPEIRIQQLEALKKNADPLVYAEVERLQDSIRSVDHEARLPLIDIALPALRSLARSQYDQFVENVNVLCEADQKIDLFEFTMQKILLRHLKDTFDPKRMNTVYHHSARGLQSELTTVMGTLALGGHDNEEDARIAFADGMKVFGFGEGMEIPLPSPKMCTLPAFDASLEKLNTSSATVKQQILNGCAVCVASDGKVTVEEAELLRAIADSLECPIPPIIL